MLAQRRLGRGIYTEAKSEASRVVRRRKLRNGYRDACFNVCMQSMGTTERAEVQDTSHTLKRIEGVC